MMQLFTLTEHSSINTENILLKLGYFQLAENSLGSRAGQKEIREKALSRFIRKNNNYLKFLNIYIEGGRLYSSNSSGVIPLEYAIKKGEHANLEIKPMLSWKTISEFAAVTQDRNWLTFNENWAIAQKLDVELWHFSKPFLFEALAVLNKPGRGYIKKTEEAKTPYADTDWRDFALLKYPFKQIGFKNKSSVMSLNTIPHSLIMWGTKVIEESISKIQLQTKSVLTLINQIKSRLDQNVQVIIPTKKIMTNLPVSGAWLGYRNLYKEIERLAILSGLLSGGEVGGCAYFVNSEVLFEEYLIHLCEKFAKENGFMIYKGKDDSSRIGFLQLDKKYKFSMLNSLKPDIAMISKDMLIVIDAKYKRHFEMLSQKNSCDITKIISEEIRHDIHQVLAYSLFSEKRLKLCLLSHPRLSSSVPYHVRRNSRNPNILVGYLPISTNENIPLHKVGQEFNENLNHILSNFK